MSGINYYDLRTSGVKPIDISDMYFMNRSPEVKPSIKNDYPYNSNIKKELADSLEKNPVVEIEDKE